MWPLEIFSQSAPLQVGMENIFGFTMIYIGVLAGSVGCVLFDRFFSARNNM